MTPASLLGWSAPIAMWLILVVFNIAAITLLGITLKQGNIRGVLREKSLPLRPPPAPLPVAGAPAADNSGPDTSYSRAAGMVGAVILVCFFWGMANVLFVQAFVDPDNIAKILSGVSPFFLSGAALFAPYAFNQLSRISKPGV